MTTSEVEEIILKQVVLDGLVLLLADCLDYSTADDLLKVSNSKSSVGLSRIIESTYDRVWCFRQFLQTLRLWHSYEAWPELRVNIQLLLTDELETLLGILLINWAHSMKRWSSGIWFPFLLRQEKLFWIRILYCLLWIIKRWKKPVCSGSGFQKFSHFLPNRILWTIFQCLFHSNKIYSSNLV